MRFLFDKTELRKLVSKEMKLLICCARTKMSPVRLEGASHLIEQGIDWNELYKLAVWHKLIPLLYHNLSNIPSGSIPESFLEQLKTKFAVNVQEQFTLLMELIHLAKLFNAHGIPFIPFKGVGLAQKIYGNLALRASGDIDILIQKSYIKECNDLLDKQKNYVINHYKFPPGLNLTGNGISAIELHNEYSQVTVDLQWHLGSKTGINVPVDELFQRSRTDNLGNIPILYFSKEDHLLALCAHGAKHLWSHLIWICDIAEFLKKYPDLNWDIIQAMAKKYRIERIVYSGIFIAHILLEAPLPFQIEEVDRNAIWLNKISAHIIRLMLNRPHYPNYHVMLDFIVNCYPQIMSTRNDQIKYVIRHTISRIKPNDLDRGLINLPWCYDILYSLFKPIRLSIKFLKL